MARIVKKKKRRRLNLLGIGTVLFTLAVLSWLATSLFVNTMNTALTMKIQQLNTELAQLKNENQTINIEIQNLENKDRVYALAQSANMERNLANVVSVSGE